jgi:hypothetical protein
MHKYGEKWSHDLHLVGQNSFKIGFILHSYILAEGTQEDILFYQPHLALEV